MKKIGLFLALVIAGALAFAAIKWYNNNKPETENTEIKPTGQKEETVSSSQDNWKTYNNEKLGITFQYPDTWTKQGEESNAVNLSGAVMATTVSFIDTESETILSMEYHFAPNGKALFEKTLSDFNSGIYANSQKIKVGGNEAIEVAVIKTKDIKGNVYDPPLKEIFVDFLDKKQTGSIHLYFKTLLPGSDTQVAQFNKILTSFQIQ